MRSWSPKQLSEAKTLALLEKFAEWGREHPRMPWRDVFRRLGLAYGLVTDSLRPVDAEAARVLKKAKNIFQRGARAAVLDKFGVRQPFQESATSPRKTDSEPSRRKAAS